MELVRLVVETYRNERYARSPPLVRRVLKRLADLDPHVRLFALQAAKQIKTQGHLALMYKWAIFSKRNDQTYDFEEYGTWYDSYVYPNPGKPYDLQLG